VHQDLGKVYKSLKSRDLLSRSLVFPQGFPQNSGNLILRQNAPQRLAVASQPRFEALFLEACLGSGAGRIPTRRLQAGGSDLAEYALK
jgi:hypothetical protein